MLRRHQFRPPARVLDALTLEHGERVLAAATSAGASWLVGTNLALHLPRRDGGYRRLGWENVERADWHRDDERLAIVEVADWGEPEQATVVTMDDPGRLLELIRERVTKSVVCTAYAPVRGRAGLRVVGRRTPSGAGPVQWSYVLSEGLDPADPQVAAVAASALEQARREVEGL